MNKALIIVFAVLFSLSLVAAEEGGELIPSFRVVVDDSSSAQPSGAPVLGFIKGDSGTSVRLTKTFSAYQNYFAVRSNEANLRLGSACQVGEYVVPVRCRTQWGSCERIFTDDWLIEFSGDLLPIHEYVDLAWYQQGESYRPWNAYHCRVPQVTSDPVADGYFSGGIRYSSNPKTNDYVTIEGSWYATKSGRLVLEAAVDPTTRRALSVLTSSRSSCDGSSFWAGSTINAVAGQRYDFKFTVKTPAEEGDYLIRAQAWTGCAKDGGSLIRETTARVDIKQVALCNVRGAVESWGDYLLGRDSSWETSSSTASNEFSKFGCTRADVTAFCGTVDNDRDGIPDGCDYCPQVRGPPSERNGCHPCFGLDLYSSAAETCYADNVGEWGWPDTRTRDIVNPIVKTEYTCRDSKTILVEQVRDFGDVASSSTQACGSNQECMVQSGRAVCADLLKTVVGTEQVCSSGNVFVRTSYSDGSSTLGSLVERCSFGCSLGVCSSDPSIDTCEGGLGCTDEELGIVPVEPDCAVDRDCGLGEYCLSGMCQADPSFCTRSEDCASDEFCNAGRCEVAFVPECLVDSQCGVDYRCSSNVCVYDPGISTQPIEVDSPDVPEENGSGLDPVPVGCVVDEECGGDQICIAGVCEVVNPWTEDEFVGSCESDVVVTCSSGGTVVVSQCVDGELVPTDLTCVTEYNENTRRPSGGPVSAIDRMGGIELPGIERVSLPSVGSVARGEATNDELITGAAVLVLLGGIGFYVSKKGLLSGLWRMFR